MAKATVSEFFHGYAEGFDAIYGNRNTAFNRVVNRHLRASMRLRFEKTLAGCDPIEGMSVLDIGTGPGHFAITLAERGAGRCVGLDFAEGMLEVARRHAARAGVAGRCEWILGDFLQDQVEGQFDYTILMGFMDYMADPAGVIEKAVSLTRRRSFFSFPTSSGPLAWQRKLRYRSKCDLFMYSHDQLEALFAPLRARGLRATIEPIARDFFVTVEVPEGP